MPIVKLMPQLISNSLSIPAGKSRIELCDADTPGLYIEVRASNPGAGTYYLRYKDEAGKTCHAKLGRTADVSLAVARKQARQLKAEIALGRNPQAEARAKKAVPILSVFFDDHYLPYAKPRKRSWRRDEQLFGRLGPKFGHLQLDQIRRQPVQTFHAALLEDEQLSPASADHHVKLLRRMLNLAVQWEMIESNPLQGIQLFNADNKVEHNLDETELARLLDVLQTDENRAICRIAMFLLSTGARLNEAKQATWDQIDRSNRLWRIPATNSKSRKVRTVPLNDSAIHILDQVAEASESEYVFANRQTGKPYASIMKVWRRLRTKAGLPHLRLHDLRHQFASLLVSRGRTLYEVQQILGHSDPKVTMRYAHLSGKALQEAADSASVLVPPSPTA